MLHNFPQNRASHILVLHQSLNVQFTLPKLGRQPLEFVLIRTNESHHVGLGGMAIDTNVLHDRAGLQDGFYFSKRYIFTCTLDKGQILQESYKIREKLGLTKL